jgi:hypothetical protein
VHEELKPSTEFRSGTFPMHCFSPQSAHQTASTQLTNPQILSKTNPNRTVTNKSSAN